MPDARASSSSTFTTRHVSKAKGLLMEVTGPRGEQRHSCRTLRCPSIPPAGSHSQGSTEPASSLAGDRRSDQTTRRRDHDFLLAREHLPAPWLTSAHSCPVARAALQSRACCCAPGDAGTGTGHHSLTFRIQRCLDRSANPCAFASLCHACRWSGGQHPLRYGRDIRHSWCLTLSPSGTFSP